MWYKFLSQGKKLPVSWDEIQAIQEMKQNHSSYPAGEFRLFNSLALVPGSPIIKQEAGISQNHSNRKLFAVSRISNFDYAEKDHVQNAADAGRFVMLVSSDNSEIAPSWIHESEIQLILKQLNGFEPANEPLAFDQVEEYEREQKTRQELLDKDIRDSRKPRFSKSDGDSIPAVASGGEPENHRELWILGAILVCAFLLWFVVNKRSRL